jgi:hypothetical protein
MLPDIEEGVTGRYAQFVGWMVSKARQHGLDAVPILAADECLYSNKIAVRLPRPGITLTLIVPPPPEDWHP